ncbi:uncharacterized protein [Argopecten irradians]|uniref:uncharacterized protein n=1 Tax=Argopecten irradians TaxID=31199 RepID=UPI0037133BC1
MAKTKTTPVKKCPMCTFRTANIDDMKEHILKCGIETMEKKTLSCPKCSYKTFRPTNMTRHQKRHDATGDVPKAAGKSLNTALSSKNSPKAQPSTSGALSKAHSPETDVESWKGQDPGDLLGEVSDSSVVHDDSSSEDDCLLAGRAIRKPTRPIPVMAPKRRVDPKDPINMVPLPVVSKKLRSSIPTQTDFERADASTQTDPYEPELKQQSVNRKTVTKTTRYSDNDRDVELVEYCEFFGAEALDRSY